MEPRPTLWNMGCGWDPTGVVVFVYHVGVVFVGDVGVVFVGVVFVCGVGVCV